MPFLVNPFLVEPPCVYPPYSCNTNVNTFCVTDFSSAWEGCSDIVSFPLLNVSSGTNFQSTWKDCTNLVSFPGKMFDNCLATNFSNAWLNCALSQQSVDNILISINSTGTSNGTLNLNGGTSSPPSSSGLSARSSLISRGWTVSVN